MDIQLLLITAGIIVGIVVAAVVVVLVLRGRRSGGTQGSATTTLPTGDDGLRTRLSASRSALAASLGDLFARDTLDDDVWEELEDALITADAGPGVAADLVARVRRSAPETGAEARAALEAEVVRLLGDRDRSITLAGSPAVIVVVGVNGTGKTTSIAKLANRFVADGHTVVLGAADTFRAAASAQLEEWGSRIGVAVVTGPDGGDPAAVAHDALTAARADGADVVIVDTAGRLHSQRNLMDELSKVVRVLERESSGIDEVLLVLDGTTGQNGIAQARAFTEAVGVTGAVLTKLDGTSRGGVAIAVEQQLGIPVKYIGVGEGMGDLVPFVPKDYVEALLEP